MSAAELVAELVRVGVQLWEESGRLHFRAPKGVLTNEQREALREQRDAVLEYLREGPPARRVTPDPAGRFDPFPLTDVQSAYLLGRGAAFPYAGVACHAYAELRFPELDTARLEDAWWSLVLRHDMLRVVVEPDGSQRVLAEVPRYRILVVDLQSASPAQRTAALEATRAELDHQVRAPERWPLFDLRVSLLNDGAILHVSIDFLICDYVSISVLFDELGRLYRGPQGTTLAPLEITFRDYLLAERGLRSGPPYERDRAYWLGRIDELPPAPDLPTLASAAVPRPARFRRWQMSLSSEEWAGLRQQARGRGVTESTAVLAAYTDVIGRWCRTPRFTLDVTLLNRLSLHPQVGLLVGDFTSVILLAVDPPPSSSFADRARGLQARLWDDMDHRLFSGVELLRELARRRHLAGTLMPVVYTSAIGLLGDVPAGRPEGDFGELVYGISQTPQVWIDCQVMERGQTLAINWDVRDDVFPDGLIDDMFVAFASWVRRVATDDAAWDLASEIPLPTDQAERRRRVNDTAGPLPDALLHESVVDRARREPERVAVVAGGRTLTHGELLHRASGVASALLRGASAPGGLVAVVMEKGWEQVVAVLGTLLAGSPYLPVDVDQPPARRNLMLTGAGVRHVLTQPLLAVSGDWPDGITVIPVDDAGPALAPAPPARRTKRSEPAYVIYTSGSTGTPKGVVVSHRSARNTIDDINLRFSVSGDDRVLGLAHLGFDLSVYDLFGPLGLGGAIVVPDAGRRADPAEWARLAAVHGVTLWNSVPAHLQMLESYLASEPTVRLPTLRLALLSGDWIPVSLPDRIRARVPGLDVISLGGATEAAIWSVVYPIPEVSAGWRSIPYGKPLSSQSVHVFGAGFRPSPDWVVGELYLGGAGLALGYLGDEARTRERFVNHPATGERLFKTGDLARFLPDGNLELIGRDDTQVKIRGYRIELAEVESALQSHPAVARAAVIVHGEETAKRQLVAFVETATCGGRGPEHGDPPAFTQAQDLSGDGLDLAVDLLRYLEFTRALDRSALLSMVRAMHSFGLFRQPGDAHTTAEIQTAAEALPRHRRIVRRWLRALVSEGFLRHDPDADRYVVAEPVSTRALDAAWDRAGEIACGMSDAVELVQFFRTCSRVLPTLIRGDRQAVDLLFPGSRLEVTTALYEDAVFNRWANKTAAAVVRQAGTARSGRGPLRVLEVGAGAGGTTAAVLEDLRGVSVEYLVTDISLFFVNKARERFAGRCDVRFDVYDVNVASHEQGVSPNMFDVIVAGDVLHSARNVPAALASLRELLRPGGCLVVLEMTRDHPQVMASLELVGPLDDATPDFDDERRGLDQTFLTRAQWLRLLGDAGAGDIRSWPDGDSTLEELGVCVFAARFKEDRALVDAAELAEHLAARLPQPMRPHLIRVVDLLPSDSNGKIDRRALAARVTPQAAGTGEAAGDAPQGDLERRIADVWASAFGVASVGRDQSFFALGGDSLIAAQLAGLLIERLAEASAVFFDDLLRQILTGPTVAEFAANLTASGRPAVAEAPRAAATPRLVKFGAMGTAPPLVLADIVGSLPGSGLARALVARGELFGVSFGNPAPYLALSGSTLLDRLARDATQLLRAEGRTSVRVFGAGFGVPLAVEVARQWMESGGTVASLILLGGEPRPYCVEDDLLAEYLFARAAGVDPETLGFPPELVVARTLGTVLAETPGRIPAGRLSSHCGEPSLDGVASRLRRLCERSPRERWEALLGALGAGPAPHVELESVGRALDLFGHTLRATASHTTTLFSGDIILLRPSFRSPLWPGPLDDAVRFWRERCVGDVRVIDVPGNEDACVRAPGVREIVEVLTAGRP
jgi:L-cysteine---[L-cysteinyl-carrier protein] ligase PchF